MAEYYVVRDKATGQYFRGKGVNKWGKYYNQASIYRIRKNAENAVEEESCRGTQAEVVEIRIIESTADVEEVVHCVDCEYLMFSDMYGECRKAHLGIVSPHDFCSRGQRRRKGG